MVVLKHRGIWQGPGYYCLLVLVDVLGIHFRTLSTKIIALLADPTMAVLDRQSDSGVPYMSNEQVNIGMWL